MLLVCAATARELLSALPEQALGPAPGAACGPAAQTGLPEQELLPLHLGLPALACITGVGPVNAALGMGLALAGARQAGHAVSLVLNVGVAGSMDLQRAPLRSLWRVEEEIWPEYGLHDGTAVDGPSFGFPQWEGPHGPVFDRLPLAAPAHLPARAVLPARGHVPERGGRQRFPAACGTAPAGPSRGPAGKYGRFCRGAGLRPPGHRLCGGTQRFQPGGAARTA